jgi:transposase, IS5 family
VYPGWRATAPQGCGASGVQAFAYLVSVNAGRFWDVALAPQLIEQIHDRIVKIAQDKGVADGAWILWWRPETQAAYRQLLNSTSRVVGQAKRFSTEVATDVKRSTDVLRQLALENLRCQIDAMVPLVRQVMKQTRARIWHGDTRADGKILSLFEPATEVIRKGKAGKLNEFGKMAKLQEAKSQIVTDYEVNAQRPNDVDLLIGAVETHQARLGRTPRLVDGQKWRTGCEGRTSVIKRQHGLSRGRYKGDAGMKRWVGLGVIADNVINIGQAMEKQSHT